MKKLLSILTVFLVITGMLHFSVARHYCGGKLAATKVSLSGALATCGMEGTEGNCPYDQNSERIDAHCCEDDLTAYGMDNNYTPAAKSIAASTHEKIQVPVMPFEKPATLSFIVHKSWSDISPPGQLMTSSVYLPNIRVFRI